jgi:YD repeat-containing protein
MSAEADNFISHIKWVNDPSKPPLTDQQKQAIIDELRKTVDTPMGRVIADSLNPTAEIDISNFPISGGGPNDPNNPTIYTLNYDLNDLGAVFAGDINEGSVANDPGNAANYYAEDMADLVAHEFSHLTGSDDGALSDSKNQAALARIQTALDAYNAAHSDNPIQIGTGSDSFNVDMTNVVKDELRPTDPSVSPDRGSYGNAVDNTPDHFLDNHSGAIAVLTIDPKTDSLVISGFGGETNPHPLDLAPGMWSDVSSVGGSVQVNLSNGSGGNDGTLTYDPNGGSLSAGGDPSDPHQNPQEVTFDPGTWDTIMEGPDGKLHFDLRNGLGGSGGSLTFDPDTGGSVYTAPDGEAAYFPPGGQLEFSLDPNDGGVDITYSVPARGTWHAHIDPFTGQIDNVGSSFVSGGPFADGGPVSQGPINFVINQYQQATTNSDFFTDPIVLDLSAANGGTPTGVQLTSINNSNAFFDLNGTGFAVHTGWVGPTTGILVDAADPTSIANLFGSSSVSGFVALEALDVSHTGVLNASDPGWATLSVWEDANGNGVADAGEVQSLSSLGITSINLNATPVNENVNGDIVGDVATFTYANGSTGQVAEAFFNNNPLNSEFNGSYTLNPEILTLPNLRGFGTMADLNIAMSLDPTLLSMVQNLTNESIADAANFTAQVKAIIYEWAGVANVDPTSRGAFVSAQDLGVLEQLTGAPFFSEGSGNPHNVLQGQFIGNAFGDFLATVEEQLLVQGPLASLFPNIAFDYDSNSLQGTADLSSVITAASAAAPTDMVAAARYWANIASFVGDVANDLGIAQSAYDNTLQSAIAASGLPADSVQLLQNSQSNLTLTAGSGNGMLIAGSGFFDILDARNSAGNDVLIAGDGNNDRLYGGVSGGNDLLIAGDGANLQLYAGAGNDTLIAGNGNNDLLSTGGGGSTISMKAGDGSGDTLDADNTNGPVTLSVGNGGNDTLVAGSGTNTLTARNGNNDVLEVLFVPSGADTLIAGSGNDTFVVDHGLAPGSSIHGGGGNDVLNAQGDISGTTISGVQTLGVAGQLTVTADQFGKFASIQSVFNFFGNDVYGTTAGTYDLAGRSTASINLHAEASGGTTLIGNNANGEHLYASLSGNDSLQIGDGNNDQLYASSGNDTLIAGNGNNDLLSTGGGSSTISMRAGDGSGDTLDADNTTGTVTLSVGNGNNDTLIAGTGADTLTAGNGSNDVLEVLFVPSGADTLIAGSGNDTFVVDHGLASGSNIQGNGGHDALNAQGDITGATINGVQTLGVGFELTVTANQFGQFASIGATFSSFGNNVFGATAGTYDLAGRSTASINLFAESNGGTTLIGNDAGNETLQASASGTDTLIAGNGSGDILSANGSLGNDVLVAGNGLDTLIGGAGTDTAVFSGNIADYDILYSPAARSFTVTDQAPGSPHSIDTITGIDIFKFANGVLTYDAQGNLVSQTTTNPNGVQEADAYNGQGDLVSQADTTASGAKWINSYDPQSTASWVWSASDYDPNGNLLSQTGLNQDGTHWLTLLDAANQYSWSNATITFDSDWNWLSVTGTNDDGSHTVTAGGIAGAYDTSLWFTTPYDPNGSSITPLALAAGPGNDVLAGHAGNDTLTAGLGNDILYGNGGSNTFAFGSSLGQDTVMDFHPDSDTLKFSSTLFANYAAAITSATQVGADTVFTIAPDESVTLRNVNRGSLAASNFTFG